MVDEAPLEVKERSRFACPFCSLHVVVGESTEGPALVHAVPACDAFANATAEDYLDSARAKRAEPPSGCSQIVKGERCPRPPVARYTWPGRAEAKICAHHLPLLERTARGLGMVLDVIPVTSEARAADAAARAEK